jgi:hypothetical protein
MRKLVITAGLLSVASATGAAAVAVTGPEMETLLSGATVEMDTPLGPKITVRYVAGGRLSGNAAELSSYLGAPTDSGRWWVEGNRLCNKWMKWFEAEVQCLDLKREGQKIVWQNQTGTRGTATIVADAPAVMRGIHGLASSAPMRLAGPTVSKPSSLALATDGDSTVGSPALLRVANVSPGDMLNVRRAPSSEAAVIGTLKPETSGVQRAGTCRTGWCPVAHAGLNGWVNAAYLEPQDVPPVRERAVTSRTRVAKESRDAPRSCLTQPTRALLNRIENRFGPVRVISTCRSGATIAGTGRPSRHASGNAVDFDAGSRKSQIIEWLVANHKAGGTMTYAGMDHIHVDVGRHFVSLAGRGGSRRARANADWSRGRMGLTR